jgi:predicted nucleotidyltransferase component of viral defense system
MTYKYNLLESLIETDFLNISNFVDIWVMKLWAIQNRATNKDYVDIYYILQKIKILDLIQKFYKKFWKVVSENIILKSLVYFDDIDEEELIMNDKKTFEEIKNHLIILSKNI